MNARTTGLVAILALSTAACAPGSGRFARERLLDLSEIASFSVGSGKGLAVDASLGALSQPSLGLYGAKTVAYGLMDRDVRGFIAESSVSAPYAFRYARESGAGFFEALNFSGWRAAYSVGRLQRGFEEVDKPLSPVAPREFGETIDGRRYGGEIVGGRWLPLPSAADRFSPRFGFGQLTEFGLGVHVAIFAARVGVNPLELVDFILGFARIDIAGDDGVRGYSAVSRPPAR
jgi:hypothetical protein